MHLRLLFIATLCVSVGSLAAQEGQGVIGNQALVEDRWTDDELEDLLAPIALHPDALIALILPAATNPSDVVLAARRLAANPDPAQLDQEPWDDSVRGLARYPEIVKWMDENLAWTRELGDAFNAQPADVMNAIQRLRAKARAAGTLQDTPQQQVVIGEEEIRIVPAQTDVIYVPRYDPTVVYVSRPVYYPSAFLSFGIGYPVGHWLAYDCDWRYRTVWIVPSPHRARVWHERRHWHHPSFHLRHRDDRWHAWRPRPVYPRPGGGDHYRHRRYYDREGITSRPQPGSPSRPRDGSREWDGQRGRDYQRHREVQLERNRQPDESLFTQGSPHTPEPPLLGGDGRRDSTDNRPASNWREHRTNRLRGGEREHGERPQDRRQVQSPLPGGQTPTMTPDVGPVVSVAPTTQPAPAPTPSVPRISPNGRRLPGNEPPREFVRSPTGRHMVAPSTPPSPPAAAPAPQVQRQAAPRFERPAMAATSGPPRESMRPQVQRSEPPRQMQSSPAPRSEVRHSRSDSGGSRSSSSSHSQIERVQDSRH